MVKRKPVTMNRERLTLPLQPSVPSSDLGDFIILLYGLPKIGKTTLAAQFPGAFFLMFEPGGKSLAIYQREVRNWDDFIQYVKLIESDTRFKTVVLDTVDIAWKMCEDAVCRQMGISHPGDEDYGKGWARVADEFTKWISRLNKAGKGVIFISHAKEKQITRRSGASSDRIVPTMAGGARRVIEPMADIFGYYEYGDDGEHQLRVRGDDLVTAGTRLTEHFKDIEDVIPMGNSPQEAYRNFMRAFDNERGGANAAEAQKAVTKKNNRVVRVKK